MESMATYTAEPELLAEALHVEARAVEVIQSSMKATRSKLEAAVEAPPVISSEMATEAMAADGVEAVTVADVARPLRGGRISG